jgi:hypothetical protein
MSEAIDQDRGEDEQPSSEEERSTALEPDEIEVEFRTGSEPTMASPGAAPPPGRVWRWVGLGIAGVVVAAGLVLALTRDRPPQATPAADASPPPVTREPGADSAAATPARLPVDGDRMK